MGKTRKGGRGKVFFGASEKGPCLERGAKTSDVLDRKR